MAKKKRASIEKLREVKQFADELLTDKKIILPHQQSALARIFNSVEAPTLPGVPAYIPYPWTINATKRVLYDLARDWQLSNSTDERKQEDVSEFFRFVISGLEEEHSKVKRLMLQSALKEEYDLKLLHRKDAVSGMAKFLVDSFAVSIVEKSNSSVSEYITWFLTWTESLLKQWGDKIRNIDGNQELQAQDARQ